MLRQTNWVAVSGMILTLVCLSWHGAPCRAASVSYGDFGPLGPGVTFADVVESSTTDPVPLFGVPSPFAVGLDFSPKSFVAASASGGGTDTTDGQLDFIIRCDPSVGITDVNVHENGVWSLLGAAGVNATLSMRLSVTQIDGVDITPLELGPYSVSDSDNAFAQAFPWFVAIDLPVAAQLVSGQRATEIKVVIENHLLASTEGLVARNLAQIAKNELRIEVKTAVVPEPNALTLAGGGLMSLAAAARIRRKRRLLHRLTN